MDYVRTQDKRRFLRQALSVPSSLRFHEDDAPLLTITTDIGLEGARFCAGRPVAKGVPVLLRLQLGNHGQLLECKGKVCWAHEDDDAFTVFGVRFIDLHEDERELLRQFLDSA